MRNKLDSYGYLQLQLSLCIILTSLNIYSFYLKRANT